MWDIVAQVGIVICGCASVWLVSRREHWRRWGYIFGMLGQPFWIYTTLHHEQWGIAAITLFYTYSWGQGIWNYWVKPAPDLNHAELRSAHGLPSGRGRHAPRGDVTDLDVSGGTIDIRGQ